jgi:hypothetical protein
MIIEEPKTQIRVDKYELVTEYFKNELHALAEQLPDDVSKTFLDVNLEYEFKLHQPLIPKEKPQYYKDKGFKVFGIPQGEVRAKLSTEAKEKARKNIVRVKE